MGDDTKTIEPINYEMTVGKGREWYFRVHIDGEPVGDAAHRIEIPMDMRGYHARSIEQYDWMKEKISLWGLADSLTCEWDAHWVGSEDAVRALEAGLLAEGAFVTETRVKF